MSHEMSIGSLQHILIVQVGDKRKGAFDPDQNHMYYSQ